MRENLTERELRLRHIDATLRDETQRRILAEAALRRKRLSHKDIEFLEQNTGLLNLASFSDQLRSSVLRVHNLGEEFCLLLLDIDYFQVVNGVAGHTAGDRLLKMIASLVGEELFPDSHCARLGTDEFAILLQGMGAEESLRCAHKLQREVNTLIFESDGERFAINASIGVVHIGKDCPDATELIRMAYSACQHAQEQKLGVRIFTENDLHIQQRHNQNPHPQASHPGVRRRQHRVVLPAYS